MSLSKLKLEELNRLTPEDYASRIKVPLTLIVDNVRSGHNVGSFFRTADAFAIEKIILCGISPRPPHKEINKTAIGASSTVEWEYYDSTSQAILALKKMGYSILGLEQTSGSQNFSDYRWNGQKTGLVVGNEVEGISNDVLPLLDEAIEVEQYGTKHSLNVSVCTGIVLWEMTRQFNQLSNL